MAISKVVCGNTTFIDLTPDTVKSNKLLKGYTAHDADGEPITGTCTFDADTQDATANVDEILDGKTAYNKGAKLTGKMPNNGAVKATVKEGNTYIIPAGYHNGSGTVSGVPGGGNYSLQSKNATPTKKQQSVTPDAGYFGLSDVTIAPIPDAFQDVTSVTATDGDVLVGKVYVDSQGNVVAGTMPDNGTVSKTLDTTTKTYTIPKGHHSGAGKVSITTESKTATPTKSQQKVTPTSGKVLSEVTIDPIPENYIDTGDADVVAENILYNKTAYAGGVKVQGTMPNNGAISKTLNTTASSYTIPAGYHNGTGKVTINLESKTITPTKSQQKITPTTEKVLSEVTVEPIPSNYIDTYDADATAENILDDRTAYVDGVKVQGTMSNNGAVSASVKEGDTYTIPKGYHNGLGTVSGVSGGGSYNLQSKTVTPTKSQQNVTPDSGYYGMSDVTVAPIPDAYQNVSSVTAGAADVLAGKVVVLKDGTVTTGTMVNHGHVDKYLDATANNSGYRIPVGYHAGAGHVSIRLESKTATPSKAQQSVKPTDGKVLSEVVVEPIPAQYQDVSGVTATSADILSGKKARNTDGDVIGSMTNNGGVTGVISKKTDTYSIPQGYHDGTGKVSIDAAEQNKLIPDNIRNGVTILGVTGTMGGATGEIFTWGDLYNGGYIWSNLAGGTT